MLEKLFSAAAERNAEPIAEVLAPRLPKEGLVLEIAAGSGQHSVYFARRFPLLQWQPTDADAEALDSVRAWREESALENLREPRLFDVIAGPWPFPPNESPTVIVAINLIHISPWAATSSLLAGAARMLPAEGFLCLYGPYFIDGKPTAPSNLSFDESLRRRNPAWGVRRLEDVVAEGKRVGLLLDTVIAMPANNFSVVFRPEPEAL